MILSSFSVLENLAHPYCKGYLEVLILSTAFLVLLLQQNNYY